MWASDQRRTGGASAYGKHIIIEHDNGWITWYAHLNEMYVEKNTKVLRGTIIGTAGNTTKPGNTMGVHLHLTVQHVGHGMSGYVVPDVVDPLPLLRSN